MRWYRVFVTASLLFVLLPWVAPVLMQLGLEVPARWIYSAYGLLCHQLPQRSFFLFGPSASYSLPTIQQAWQDTGDPWVLRQFIGTAAMGYKVAWSDRMVTLFTSIPVAAMVWWPLRRWVRALPLWGFALLALPMAIDGGTHVLSDLSGIGQGFRDTNAWLAGLTGGLMPADFYAGDALGSFNSWMRLVTGALFGGAAVWVSLPRLFEEQATDARGRSLPATSPEVRA